jgi:hypothetical protein
VRGVPGVLVANPAALGMNPPRYIGKVAIEPASGGAPFAPDDFPFVHCFDDVEESIADSAHIRSAVKRGELDPVDNDTARRCGVSIEVV